MKYVATLVRVFANHDLDAVKQDASLIENAVGSSLEVLSTDADFPREQKFVETLKFRIEGMRDKLETPDKRVQIAECLRMLLQMAMFEKSDSISLEQKMETMRDLLLEMYGASWSAEQRHHFDFIFACLKQWNSYFLSYTNEGGAILNRRYGDVIALYVDPDTRKKRDLDKENLLADAIVSCLRKRLLRNGFYDKDRIKTGDDLDACIAPAAAKTFAFVQLVQRETFDILRERNWCHVEYVTFEKHSEQERHQHGAYAELLDRRFSAVLAAEQETDVAPPVWPYEYEAWKVRIFQKKRFLRLPVEPGAFDKAMSELAAAIVAVKDRLIATVPG